MEGKTPQENTHSFFSIDSKNSFSITDEKVLNKKLEELFDSNNTSKKTLNLLMNNFLEKVFQKSYSDDIFLFCSNISKYYLKNTKISKTECEKLINYFVKNKQLIAQDSIYKFSKNDIINLGQLICFIYKKFATFKIKNESDLINHFNESNGIDVMKDFQNYCKDHNLNPNEKSKVLIWKEMRKKYIIPPELLFIKTIFCYALTIDFDLDFDNNILNQEELTLFTIILFNIQYIFTSFQNIYLNFTNHKCVKSFIEFSENELIQEITKNQWNMTSITKINNSQIKRKWSFSNEFIKDNPNNNNQLYHSNTSNIISALNFSFMDNKELLNEKITYNKVNIEELIKKNCTILQLILIISYTFSRLNIDNLVKINKLKIIFIDSLFQEILKMLSTLYSLNQYYSTFHFIDQIKFLNSIYELRLEFNSLDIISFEKIINFIYLNKNLKDLKISFFTEEMIYYPGAIYKLYNNLRNKNNLKLKDNSINEEIQNLCIQDLENDYSEKLSLFFTLLKKKVNIEYLSIFLDVPSFIISSDTYYFILIKFILNIFLLIDNTNYKLKYLKILAPKIKFNSFSFPGIDELFSEINLEKNNYYLKEIYLQFQFNSIENLSNLISSRLLKISIGDLDLITFESVVNHLSKISFSQISQLESINISLLNSITNFSDVKKQLRQLFFIHYCFLDEIFFYNHIIFDKKEVNELLEILNKNWIRNIGFSIYKSLNEENNNITNELFSKLIYFQEQKPRKHIILYKLFKGNRKILTNIYSYLYKSDKVNISIQC